MGTIIWILGYFALSLIWIWIIFWGGAGWLKKSVIGSSVVYLCAILLLNTMVTPGKEEKQIKLFALVFWIAQTICFLVGLWYPDSRRFPINFSSQT